MRVPARVKDAQMRLAYRLSVQACLEVYYGQPAADARANADAWWERLSKTSAFRSGYFMHPDPINTAGEIADKQIVELNERNYKAYEQLMEEIWNLAHNANRMEEASPVSVGQAVGVSR